MKLNKMAFISMLALSVCLPGLCQQSYITREGTISFYSSAPLEDIEAVNEQVHAVLDNSSGNVAVRLRIEDFQFARALMQRHFNENFMESHIYPEARFAGEVRDFEDLRDFENTLEVEVEGQLTIHGVTRDAVIPVTIERHGPFLICDAQFPISVADYNIEIPRLFIRNIAEVVEVTASFRLSPAGN
jgi:hypothetical protein